MGSEKCASWQKITRDDDVTAFLGFSTLMGINVLATLHGQLLAVRQDPEIHPVVERISRDRLWVIYTS